MKSTRRGADAAFDFDGSYRFPLVADEGSGRWRDQMGEYVLAEAVLWQAIREYQKLATHRTRREAELFRELDQWFLEDDRKWDFSFVNLCQILDLEPTCIRASLRLWRERTSKQDDDVRFRTVQRKTVTRPRPRRQVGRLQAPMHRRPGSAPVFSRGA